MNDLGELYGIVKVWLLGLKILDDFLYPIIKFLVYLIFIDLIIPIPEENSLEFLPLHELRPKNMILTLMIDIFLLF